MNELKDLGLSWFWVMIGITVGYWLVEHVKDNAAQLHYWRGRKDGWDMHRRMNDNKVKTDEVFDYDKD